MGLPQPRALRVLVVDDHPDILQSTVELLSCYNYDAAGALGVREALESAADRRPDVVLLELAMTGAAGWEVARRLRDGGPGESPVLVAVTTVPPDVGMGRARESGCRLYLTKPVHPEDLRAALTLCHCVVALRERSGERAATVGS